MSSQSQTTLILSQLEEGVANLQRTVQSFELATANVERHIQELEQQESQGELVDETSLAEVLQTLRESAEVATQVTAIDTLMDERITLVEGLLRNDAPLPAGALLLEGGYRVVQLLHTRPRVHLYLARPLGTQKKTVQGQRQTFVAVREIVLAGLAQSQRERIEHAAFEEFAAPMLFGSQHFPCVGARPFVENERHYQIMQLRPARGSSPVLAVPLSELLPGKGESPSWFSLSTAQTWGIELCRLVVRLHRTKNLPGDLTPEMVIVSRDEPVNWSPVLLASWPPGLLYWSEDDGQEASTLVDQIFPTIELAGEQGEESGEAIDESVERPFLAPEIFEGRRDERSDVYSLGALLYLLFTHHTPRSAHMRLHVAQALIPPQRSTSHRGRKAGQLRTRPGGMQGEAGLVSPRLLCEGMPLLLEQIVLRALALDPAQRFATVLELVNALESARSQTATAAFRTRSTRLGRFLKWFRKN